MSQAYTNFLIHCIFSTRDRLPQIDPELAPALHAYLGGIARSFRAVALSVNGVADHVHLLLSIPATVSVADAIRLLKSNSSKWVHEQNSSRSGFAWQTGYGAFSVSLSNMEAVKTYIAQQEEHHRHKTFQEEFLEFLKKHGIPYDERHVWQ